MNKLQELARDRKGYVSYAPQNAVALTDKEFLEKTLEAVKRRRGLIHGDMRQKSRVCALGALACSYGEKGVTLQGDLPRLLQAYNDSMPKVTPEQRREKVIVWLEKLLRKLAS